MRQRTPSRRFLALLWAAFQLATPAVSGLADARLAAAAAGREPVAHVESSTSSTCPVVHPPDCGICRYLSSPAAASTTAGAAEAVTEGEASFRSATWPPACVAVVLPDGRAPPGL